MTAANWGCILVSLRSVPTWIPGWTATRRRTSAERRLFTPLGPYLPAEDPLPGTAPPRPCGRDERVGVYHVQLAQTHSQRLVRHLAVGTGHQQLGGVLACELVVIAPVRGEGTVGEVKRARLRGDVPEPDLVLAHQRPRQRVLRRVVEHRQPGSARETQLAGLAQGRGVTHEAGGAKPRG